MCGMDIHIMMENGVCMSTNDERMQTMDATQRQGRIGLKGKLMGHIIT
jgi:hypothetical protein